MQSGQQIDFLYDSGLTTSCFTSVMDRVDYFWLSATIIIIIMIINIHIISQQTDFEKHHLVFLNISKRNHLKKGQ